MTDYQAISSRIRDVLRANDVRTFIDAGRDLRVESPDDDEDAREDVWSYAAIRNYILGKRNAPADFLQRVAEVYTVPLSWLMTGDGDVRLGEGATRRKPTLIDKAAARERPKGRGVRQATKRPDTSAVESLLRELIEEVRALRAEVAGFRDDIDHRT